MKLNDKGILSLSNRLAECKISLWGGNVVSYRPRGEVHDVFWLGNLNKFDNVQAIRGGIPVCWPRFSEETLNNDLPRHGFARLSEWKTDKVLVDDNVIEVVLSLVPDIKYGLDVSAKLFVKVTDKLQCVLETTNNGKKEFKFSEALHAYFNVGERDQVEIKGFDGCKYCNFFDGSLCEQKGNLTIKKEFDAAFINHRNAVEIVDPMLNRVIYLKKEGSDSTVVWNPNKDLPEMSFEQYKNFVCVEPSNQGNSFVTLKAGEKHQMTMIVEVSKLKQLEK